MSSVEETVSDTLQTPFENNAESAEDVKNLLAEFKGESTAPEQSKNQAVTDETKTNGVVKENGDAAVSSSAPEAEPAEAEQAAAEQSKSTQTENGKDDTTAEKPRERKSQDHGQSNRGGGGRGRGRGRGGFHNRSLRQNIKSDLTTQEESNDPVEIRKQVCAYYSRPGPGIP